MLFINSIDADAIRTGMIAIDPLLENYFENLMYLSANEHIIVEVRTISNALLTDDQAIALDAYKHLDVLSYPFTEDAKIAVDASLTIKIHNKRVKVATKTNMVKHENIV